ncbi:MAG: EpsG family protein [Paludibacteraceae bacterium]|nr:EpsG family protein [Paludibacteraceae bacterium]
MLGYFLFFFALWVCSSLHESGKALKLIFIVVSVFSGLRYGIGYDYYTYLWCCFPESYGSERFEYIPRFMAEISQKTIPYLFFVMSSIFISYFYYIGIKNGGKNYILEVMFYIGFPFLFLNQLGIVRQGMATSVVFLAIVLRYSKYEGSRLLLFRILLIAIAFFCHKSAILSVLILLSWEEVSKKTLWKLFFSCLVLGVFITPYLESFIPKEFFDDMDFMENSESAVKYFYREAHGEGKMMKWLIYLIGVLSLSLYDKLIAMDKRNAYYIGVLVLGISFYALFSYNSTLSKRFCIFFFSSSIFIVPQIARIFKISKFFYLSMCVILFMLQVYIGSSNMRPQDSCGTSVTYPYRTFLDQIIK